MPGGSRFQELVFSTQITACVHNEANKKATSADDIDKMSFAIDAMNAMLTTKE